MGPYLNVGGEYLEYEGKRIPLPFLALYKAFPIFDRISHPFRFVIGVNLAFSLLAAHGLRSLLRRRKDAVKMAVLSAGALFVWMELSFASPAQLPIPCSDGKISQAYWDMNTDEEQGAVLDLPLTVPNLERAIYVWNQSAHNRPVPWGLNDPMPRNLLQNRLINTLIQIESTRAMGLPAILPELDLVISSRVLIRQGYRYIVLHEKFYPPFKFRQVANLLKALYGEPKQYSEDGIYVYLLEMDE